MSGIVGLVNLDGAPVERDLLQRMTDFMAYRGPDRQDVWLQGPVGLGHTLLGTTCESQHERQPCSLDGQVWITADARVDGRAELKQKLAAAGRTGLKTATDAELILHTYHLWGEDCVRQLLGDFVFAIWDGRRQRLFCARDHFGVKPLYYAQLEHGLVFSNTLNCIRAHPAVSDELNELAIADFLLIGFNQEPATTTFTGIQRLPPAHTLTLRAEARQGEAWANGSLRVSRYWTLPIEETVRYKRPDDYVDNFRELFRLAVDDRLRTDQVGVFMSGGLDSTSVAAVSRELLSQQFGAFDLRAYTVVYDRLIPDQERYWSGLVAEHLGIPIRYLAADNYQPYERWHQAEFQTPEPDDGPLIAIDVDQFRQVASHSRVVLSGDGGDPVFYPSRSYLVNLLADRQFGRLLAEVGGYVLAHGHLPPLYFRSQLRRRLGKRGWRPAYPPWFNQAFASRLNLRLRWDKLTREAAPRHPTHAEAYQFLTGPFWPSVFERLDPGTTGFPLEVRNPFFDLRLVAYLLTVPPVPWCVHKALLRAAMRDLLPEPVRLRPKTPLAGEPLPALLERGQEQWVDHLNAAQELAKYVDLELAMEVANTCKEADVYETDLVTRPLSLAYWLRRVAPNNGKENLSLAEGALS